MHSSRINGEGELRGQLANPSSPGKIPVKMECVCVKLSVFFPHILLQNLLGLLVQYFCRLDAPPVTQ